jgi:hypothetical protein
MLLSAVAPGSFKVLSCRGLTLSITDFPFIFPVHDGKARNLPSLWELLLFCSPHWFYPGTVLALLSFLSSQTDGADIIRTMAAPTLFLS